MDSYMQSILTGLEGAGDITEVRDPPLQNLDSVVGWGGTRALHASGVVQARVRPGAQSWVSMGRCCISWRVAPHPLWHRACAVAAAAQARARRTQ